MTLAERSNAPERAAPGQPELSADDLLHASVEPTPEMVRDALRQVAQLSRTGTLDPEAAELVIRHVLAATVTEEILHSVEEAFRPRRRRRRFGFPRVSFGS